MRWALAVVVLSACGRDEGPVRVTAYGRCGGEGVRAAGVEIRSYANQVTTPFATADTDTNGVATLAVPAGGSIVYRSCGSLYESIEGVEPGDDLIVGDPTPPATPCSTGTGSMTVAFPTVANAASYTANGVSSTSPTVVISGCNNTQISVAAEAYDSYMQLLGYQSQTVELVDQSTLQLATLLPPATLDLTVNPPPDFPPALDGVQAGTGGPGVYSFVYANTSPTARLTWDKLYGNSQEPAAEITISTAQTSVAIDVAQRTTSYDATRFIGYVANGAPTGDLEIYAEYLVDAPPGTQLSPPSLPIELPPASAQNMPVNVFRAFAIRDNQYDDYGDFRSQRRHLDRDVLRSVLNIGGEGMVVSGGYTWPTSR